MDFRGEKKFILVGEDRKKYISESVRDESKDISRRELDMLSLRRTESSRDSIEREY